MLHVCCWQNLLIQTTHCAGVVKVLPCFNNFKLFVLRPPLPAIATQKREVGPCAIMEVLHPALHQLLPELAIVAQLNLPGGGWDMLPWMDDTTPHTDSSRRARRTKPNCGVPKSGEVQMVLGV